MGIYGRENESLSAAVAPRNVRRPKKTECFRGLMKEDSERRTRHGIGELDGIHADTLHDEPRHRVARPHHLNVLAHREDRRANRAGIGRVRYDRDEAWK